MQQEGKRRDLMECKVSLIEQIIFRYNISQYVCIVKRETFEIIIGLSYFVQVDSSIYKPNFNVTFTYPKPDTITYMHTPKYCLKGIKINLS